MKTIGVAMATRNGGRYISDLLESIRGQSTSIDFLLVSDDASTDNTCEIVEAFAIRVSFPVRLIRNSVALGVRDNFLQAFSACRSDYIIYADQDDIWFPGKVESLRNAVEQNDNLALVFHQSEVVDENLSSLGLVIPDNLPPGVYRYPHVPVYIWGHGHQMMFRSDVALLLKNILPNFAPSSPFFNNLDLALMYFATLCGDVEHVKRPLVKFRRHASAVSPIGQSLRVATSQSASWIDQRKSADLTSLNTAQRSLDSLLTVCNDATIFKSELDSKIYMEQLNRVTSTVNDRQIILQSPFFFKKLISFFRLVASQAYGNVSKNRYPLRFMVKDFIFVCR